MNCRIKPVAVAFDLTSTQPESTSAELPSTSTVFASISAELQLTCSQSSSSISADLDSTSAEFESTSSDSQLTPNQMPRAPKIPVTLLLAENKSPGKGQGEGGVSRGCKLVSSPAFQTERRSAAIALLPYEPIR